MIFQISNFKSQILGLFLSPTETYWLSLILLIAGALIIGFCIAWPIARRVGYRDGAVDGYDGCLEEFFDENGEPRTDRDDDSDIQHSIFGIQHSAEVPDSILDAQEIA